MELVNRTGHDIIVLDDDNNVVATYPAAKPEDVARVTVEEDSEYYPVEVDGVRTPILISNLEYSEVVGLPEDEYGDIGYIVDQVVKDAVEAVNVYGIRRCDLYVPYQLVRDEEGRVIRCKGFSF